MSLFLLYCLFSQHGGIVMFLITAFLIVISSLTLRERFNKAIRSLSKVKIAGNKHRFMFNHAFVLWRHASDTMKLFLLPYFLLMRTRAQSAIETILQTGLQCGTLSLKWINTTKGPILSDMSTFSGYLRKNIASINPMTVRVAVQSITY